jgi:phosphoserine aminotransferase
VPTVVDMSSDILSRRIDYNQFDLIFAGAQKNVGPSGLCVVLIRKSFAEQGREDLPPFLQYRHQMAAQSLYNTPNTFAIYMADLVFEYLESMGGIDAIESINRKKAKTL